MCSFDVRVPFKSIVPHAAIFLRIMLTLPLELRKEGFAVSFNAPTSWDREENIGMTETNETTRLLRRQVEELDAYYRLTATLFISWYTFFVTLMLAALAFGPNTRFPRRRLL